MIATVPPLRILMTADPIGGVWTFSLDLMKVLEGSSVRFALATMGRRLAPNQREQVAGMPNVRLYESEFKLEWMEDPWEDVARAADWLLEIAAEFEPDLIHLNGYVHAALPWNQPVLVAAHSCVYSWFRAVKGLPPPRQPWSRYHHHVRQGLKAATMVTAPTETMLSALNIHYGDTFDEGRVIYNGRPASLFQPKQKDEIILTGGRLWDEAKNIRILDAAASAIAWPILAAGEQEGPGGGKTHLKNLHGLGSLSPQSFAEQLSRASIYALPARYEPFGLSALEAALSGCALVLGDIPSLREIWADAALFVDPNDRSGWIDALEQLIADAPFRTGIARRAYKRAATFTVQRMAAGYLHAYRTILTNHRKQHENHSLLPLAPLGLESRKRPFPSRLRN